MFEAYKVAVKITLINEVSKGLLSMSGQFAKLHKDADVLQAKLSKLKTIGAVGVGVGAAGLAGLDIISKTIKPASEYAHQLALMNQQGMKHADIVKSINAAWATNRLVPTSSASGNLETVRHLRMIFGPGNIDNVLNDLPTIQKIQGILQTFRGSGSRDESYELAKSLEIRGAVKTPAQFIEQADMMTRAIVASGGKVAGSDFLSAFKFGRAATSGWSNEFAYTILPTLIQEMKSGGIGGSGTGGPGNALMSAYSAVVGGVIPQRSLKTWQKLGLLDPSKIVWTKTHSAKGLEPGGIKGSQEFIANPFAWSQKYLIPALVKAGYTTEAQQKEILQYLYPNRTADFVMTQFVTQAWKFKRDQKLIGTAKGIAGYNALLQADPMLASMALQKQWQNLLAILGYQIMPPLLKTTLFLVNEFRELSTWFSKNQDTAKTLIIAFGSLFTSMTISGTIIGVAVAFKALQLVGLGMLIPISGAIVGLGALSAAIYAVYTAVKHFGIDTKIGKFFFDLMHPSDGSSHFKTIDIGPNAPAQHANPVAHQNTSAVVHLALDGRSLAHAIMPYITDGLYHAQISNPNRFNPSMAPTVPGTSAPY